MIIKGVPLVFKWEKDITINVNTRTFEKVSFDKYLIASFIKSTKKNKKNIIDLIEIITGKGSLNNHFKKLYDNMEKLDNDEIEKILSDSLYPVIKMEKTKYSYNESLKFSEIIYRGRKKVFKEKIDEKFVLSHKEQFIEKDEEYISCDFIKGEKKESPDRYIVNIENGKFYIDYQGEKYQISKSLLKEQDFNQREIKRKYKGKIFEITEKEKIQDWIFLEEQKIDVINSNSLNIFIEGILYQVNPNNLVISKISNFSNIYVLNEKIINYEELDHIDSEKILNELIYSSKINEIKNKNIVVMLKKVNDSLVQKVINVILAIKEVKELSEIALDMMKKNLLFGWDLKILSNLNKFKRDSKDLKNIYKLDINSNIKYLVEELDLIQKEDNTILRKEDKKRLEKHVKNKNDIINEINQITGEILNSGIREKIRNFKMSSDLKKLRNFITYDIAHNKENIENKSLEELKKLLDKYKKYYDLFKKIKTELNL